MIIAFLANKNENSQLPVVSHYLVSLSPIIQRSGGEGHGDPDLMTRLFVLHKNKFYPVLETAAVLSNTAGALHMTWHACVGSL